MQDMLLNLKNELYLSFTYYGVFILSSVWKIPTN